jgi:hypothetical protein
MEETGTTKGEERGESGRRFVTKATHFSLKIIRENEFIIES